MRSLFRAALLGCLSCYIGCTSTICTAAEPQATPADRIHLPEGFQAELLYSVPAESEGSWVNMTPDPQGRLIVSDQYGSLYRVTPAADAAATKVERLNVDIGAAQGLLYAFDSLYVMVNGKAAEGSGLYRVQDTNGDDQFDTVKLLRKINGGGEHGPHAILLAPDGKSLYVCGGNHTDLPNPETSRVPRNWQEDQLLPRMWDAGGHAVGKLAPGGWVCKTDPEGKSFELIGSGFRNEYDIAFNPAGDLFTFDADMEWDIGSPWYRPTRVCNVTSGSEFGWRSGTGKWPTYYPDSLPAAVDIGPGSPTGISFGTGARFPAKYQNALFVADWSFGLIYAVHLKPDGSSYRGTFERFATASPLPVTDIVINPRDGAMYFTIGGRRTQSGLYRVTYSGGEDTSAVAFGEDAGTEARQRRAELEALHTPNHPAAVETAWPFLADQDRFLQFAARIAIEHQPVAEWSELALAEKNPRALIVAMVALARCGNSSLQGQIIDALDRISWDDLSARDQLGLLRAYGLALARMGQPSAETRSEILARLNGLYPAVTQPLNRELSQLLIYLEAPKVVERTLKLLTAAPTQEEQVHYFLALRTLNSGWTMDQRRQYFGWFTQSGGLRGGNSFPKFLRKIRAEAAGNLSEQERSALAALIKAEPASTDVNQTVKARPHVKKWVVADLLDDVGNDLKGRDFARGREVFAAVACFKCHRFNLEGGIIGPDLTGVGKRFTPQYVLESLIEPNKAISDQYQATVFVTDKGKTVIGKVANLNGKNLMIITNMLEPGTFTQVNVDTIEEQLVSPVSMMPAGMLDTLTRDEILDLVAYLRSGGDPHDEAFKEGTSLVEPGSKVKKLVGGMKFTEGPVWLADEKKLIFSDIPNSKLMQWSAANGLSVYRQSEQANGNILDLKGRLISCQHRARNLVRSEADGSITVLADRFDGKRFNSPNDVAVRSDGTLWFTDPPWGLTGPHEIPGHWVFKLDPKSGQIEAIIKDLAMPNGIVFSPDESRLYVADTGGNRRHPDPKFHDLADGIHCYALSVDGKLGKKLFQINAGSDGMAVDVQGNLYTTHGGKVLVYDADGTKLEEIAVPEGPANVCFGDDDFRTLYITARTSLYSLRVVHPGAKPKRAE